MQRIRNLEIKSQAIERVTLMADGVFDFNRLPMSVIDKGWKRFHPYLLMIDRYHPLMYGYFKKPADVEKLLAHVKEVITGTFHINETLFKTLDNTGQPSVALLVPDTDDNVEIIEESFEKLGLYRYEKSSEFILTDPKGRQWVDMRFAEKENEDVTDEIYQSFFFLYFLTPNEQTNNKPLSGIAINDRTKSIDDAVMNNKSESFALFSNESYNIDDIRELAKKKLDVSLHNKFDDMTSGYMLLTYDANKMGLLIRFFLDTRSRRLYTKCPVPQKYLIKTEE